MTLLPSRARFSFGTDQQCSRGKLPIKMPMENGALALIMTDVVPIDVPFLIGLDVLTKFKMVVDNVDMVLDCRENKTKLPIVKKQGHLYLPWTKDQKVWFTKEELNKLHKGFHHPSPKKLHDLLKRARPDETDSKTMEILKDISQKCDPCQRMGPTPIRFRASIPEAELVFGDEVSIDLTWINGVAVMHLVDTATRFSAATFVPGPNTPRIHTLGSTPRYGQSVDGVWAAFIECWCAMYTGYPNRIRTDHGSIFTSPRWIDLAADCGIHMQISGVESHNSTGLGEKMHDPLKRIYRKIQISNPDMRKDVLLKLAVKATNDTIGLNGLVPSLLVFGIIPRFPIISSELPQQEARMKVLAEARAEYEAIIAEMRITAAMRHAVPEAANRTYDAGKKVLVFRENDKEWCGPLTVIKTEGKIVTVKGDGGSLQEFNKVNVKPYFEDQDEEATEILYQMLKPFRSRTYKKKVNRVHITEVIKNGDPRARLFEAAKEKEIKGLIDRGTWKVVSTHDLPRDANIMGGRFVLAIKNEGTKDELYKARFVVQGYRDKMKTSLVHDSATSRQVSTRILVALAAIFGFKLLV